jgi:hypothetical protein
MVEFDCMAMIAKVADTWQSLLRHMFLGDEDKAKAPILELQTYYQDNVVKSLGSLHNYMWRLSSQT